MQMTSSLSKNNSLRLTPQHSARRLSFCSQVATGQHSSPIVFPEKRSKVKNSKRSEIDVSIDDPKKTKGEEHRIDIGDEKSDLLGYDVFSGKLVLDKRKANTSSDANTSTDITNQDSVDANLTSKALVWGSQLLSLGDVVSIIKNEDLEEVRELGSGTFGTVYHGKWRGSDVAIKGIKKSCFAVFYITLKEYLAELSLTALICVMGTVEGGIVALIMERNNMSAWIVGFDSRLFAVVYSGLVCSGIVYYVQGFVNKIRGPVFVTAFSPLFIIITSILGAIVLGELVQLGTLIGATGLYSVVRGKFKDENLITGEVKAQELPEVWEDVSRPGNSNFQMQMHVAEFLCPILVFAPDKRPTAQQCLQHPWLNTKNLNIDELVVY